MPSNVNLSALEIAGPVSFVDDNVAEGGDSATVDSNGLRGVVASITSDSIFDCVTAERSDDITSLVAYFRSAKNP